MSHFCDFKGKFAFLRKIWQKSTFFGTFVNKNTRKKAKIFFVERATLNKLNKKEQEITTIFLKINMIKLHPTPSPTFL